MIVHGAIVLLAGLALAAAAEAAPPVVTATALPAAVPAYPASHGCVRIPMWLARTLFSSHGYGTTVFVH